jgi:hypothetical protein
VLSQPLKISRKKCSKFTVTRRARKTLSSGEIVLVACVAFTIRHLFHPSFPSRPCVSRWGKRECEQQRNAGIQPLRYLLNSFKRWRTDPSFDQTEEVHGNANEFCELFLREFARCPNRFQAEPKGAPERTHEEYFNVAVVSLRITTEHHYGK